MSELKFDKFVRRPFIVEAIQITKENILQVAPLVGTAYEDENGHVYIAIDRKRVPNVYKAYVGFWVTKFGDNVRCYSQKSFESQFEVGTESSLKMVEALELRKASVEEHPSKKGLKRVK